MSESLAAIPPRLRSLAIRARVLRPVVTYKTPDARELVTSFVRSFGSDALIVNVGAGETRYGKNVMNFDIVRTPGVDVVAGAEQLPIADCAVDAVILQAVLEHVRDAGRVLDEAHRVLRPGGRMLVEMPFMQGYHPTPGDYRRFTEVGLREELARHGFSVEASGVVVGPASAVTWIGSEFGALLLSGRSVRAYRVVRLALRMFMSPLRFVDRWLAIHPMAHVIASGFWATSRKVSS